LTNLSEHISIYHFLTFSALYASTLPAPFLWRASRYFSGTYKYASGNITLMFQNTP